MSLHWSRFFARIFVAVVCLACGTSALGAAPTVELVRNHARADRFARSGHIKDIRLMGDAVYFATAGGLVVHDAVRDTWTQFHDGNSPLPANYVARIAIDESENAVWLATAGGVACYRPGERTAALQWKVYAKKDGLADEETTAITVDSDFVWVGTRYWGVMRFDKKQQLWRKAPYTPIDGLGANRIHDLVTDGDQIWAATDDGLSVYDRYADMWTTYDAKEGLTAKQVTCVDSDGKNIWAGTYGGGVHRFDKDSMKFQVFRTEQGLADNIVFAVRCDGDYVWVGTFGGVSRLDRTVDGGAWTSFTKAGYGIVDNAISALALSGNRIWFGSDGEGASLLDKKTPEVRVLTTTGYEKPKSVVIRAALKNAFPVATTGVLWRPSLYVTQPYSTTGLTLLEQGRIIGATRLDDQPVARLDATALKEGLGYDLVVEITDGRGNRNRAVWPLVIDNTVPVIRIDDSPETVATREYTLRGSYLELYPRDIEWSVNGGKFSHVTEVDRKMRSWKQSLVLAPGENKIEIRIGDIARQTASASRIIRLDETKPVIKLGDDMKKAVTPQEKFTIKATIVEDNPEEVYLMPGRVRGKFVQAKKGEWTFEVPVTVAKGANKFQIVAVDKAGGKTTADIVVTFNTEAPSVTLAEDLPSEFFGEFYTVRGSWDDKDLREIGVSPGGVPASIDRDKKTFEARVKLEAGFNTIRVRAVDEQDNERIVELQVIYKTGDAADPAALQRDSAENYRLYVEYKKKYEDLLEKYRQLLLQLDRIRAGEPLDKPAGPFVPPGNSFYFVNYDRSAGDSLESISTRLYGNDTAKGLLARFNGQAAGRTAIVVPTPALIQHLLTAPDRLSVAILAEVVAVVYGQAGQGGSWWQFRQQLAGALAANGLAASPDGDGVQVVQGRMAVLVHAGAWETGVALVRRKMAAGRLRSGYIVFFQGSYVQLVNVN